MMDSGAPPPLLRELMRRATRAGFSHIAGRVGQAAKKKARRRKRNEMARESRARNR